MIDRQIIEDCRNGNQARFRELVSETVPHVFRTAFRIVGDEETSRDIVQETMVTIWQNIKGIKSAEAYGSWVRRITINKCYDHLREKRKIPEFRFDERTWKLISESISGDDLRSFDNDEIARVINALTSDLSPRQKIVFILSEIEDTPHDEISRITGISKVRIKANLWHARQNINEKIRKYL